MSFETLSKSEVLKRFGKLGQKNFSKKTNSKQKKRKKPGFLDAMLCFGGEGILREFQNLLFLAS